MENQNQPSSDVGGNPPTSPELVEGQSAKSPYGRKNWLKWFLIYALIAVVVYGAVYFLFLSKQGLDPYSASNQAPNATPQPTQVQDETVNTEASRSANWKTYTNQELGFSIKYPEKLVYKEIPNQTETGYPTISNLFSIFFENPDNKREFGNSIHIRVYEARDKTINLDTVSIEKLTFHGYFPTSRGTWQEVDIGKFKGKYIETTGGVLVGYGVLLAINNKIFYFNLYDYSDTYITKKDFFQILSTFKFTDQ